MVSGVPPRVDPAPNLLCPLSSVLFRTGQSAIRGQRCQDEVLATRITIVGTRDRGPWRAGEIDYIAEAHVEYEKDGVRQDEWLRASEQFTSRAELLSLAFTEKEPAMHRSLES